MNNVKLTPSTIFIGLLVGSLVGPLSQVAKGVTTADLVNTMYWLDLVAATITAFAASAVGILGLLGVAVGMPLLRAKTDTPPVA